jgi:hypothetical protein
MTLRALLDRGRISSYVKDKEGRLRAPLAEAGCADGVFKC